jgi:hypothetical protein
VVLYRFVTTKHCKSKQYNYKWLSREVEIPNNEGHGQTLGELLKGFSYTIHCFQIKSSRDVNVVSSGKPFNGWSNVNWSTRYNSPDISMQPTPPREPCITILRHRQVGDLEFSPLHIQPFVFQLLTPGVN